ncbi:hypothetical protein LXA43DRAFT_898124 [Ganoderma leucocontextum]|nr:hypothetical protein LXA43DRAFT_898124 [Ganoderma leucocontextum]
MTILPVSAFRAAPFSATERVPDDLLHGKPMTTEEDLLQEDLIGEPAVYTSYGPFKPERRRRIKFVQAIADFIRRLRQNFGRRRPSPPDVA